MSKQPIDEQLRTRAYLLWEEEGRPDGRAHEFWERAESMLEADPARLKNNADEPLDVEHKVLARKSVKSATSNSKEPAARKKPAKASKAKLDSKLESKDKSTDKPTLAAKAIKKGATKSATTNPEKSASKVAKKAEKKSK